MRGPERMSNLAGLVMPDQRAAIKGAERYLRPVDFYPAPACDRGRAVLGVRRRSRHMAAKEDGQSGFPPRSQGVGGARSELIPHPEDRRTALSTIPAARSLRGKCPALHARRAYTQQIDD